MGVISEILREASAEGAKWLTLKNVYDWRFRSPGKGEHEKWLRRCRIVCREFKTITGSPAETFAPTSGLAAIKLMVTLYCVLRFLLWIIGLCRCVPSSSATGAMHCGDPGVDQEATWVHPRYDLASEKVFARTKERRFEMV